MDVGNQEIHSEFAKRVTGIMRMRLSYIGLPFIVVLACLSLCMTWVDKQKSQRVVAEQASSCWGGFEVGGRLPQGKSCESHITTGWSGSVACTDILQSGFQIMGRRHLSDDFEYRYDLSRISDKDALTNVVVGAKFGTNELGDV